MGARVSSAIRSDGDAGRLIDIAARRRARVDMGDASAPLPLDGIEIGVEHAAAAAELELEAGAFADLQRRVAEMADQLAAR